MFFNDKGEMMFNDSNELSYNMLMTIGLAVNRTNGYIYDQDNGTQLQFKGKAIKGSINGEEIYSGPNDIAFEPVRNYKLVITLLGYYMDKLASFGNDVGFKSQGMEDTEDKAFHRAFLDTVAKGKLFSKYYHISSLGLIELIFKLDDTYVDLSNFDISEEDYRYYEK